MWQQVGTVRVREEEEKIEWEINNFLQLDINEVYRSPFFNFRSASGYFGLFLDLQLNESFEFLRICIRLTSMPKHWSNATVTFNLKAVDGESDFEKPAVYYEEKNTFKVRRLISGPDLIERQSELLPSGTVTVICTLKDNGPNVVSERKFLNASAQTDEGTGVWELRQHLCEISRNANMSDIILKAGGQEFKVHRCILAARSPVLSVEMKENVTGVVDIQDMEPKTLSDFIDILYTGNTRCLTSENVVKLYAAADKYKMDVLKEICLDHMLTNISVENFCGILRLSVQYKEEKLYETCIQYFGEHLLDILKTCKWQSLLCENSTICNELYIKHLELKK